ncbi:MAG: GntR family transcriptional regulator [Burkholderiaceae bacterium]|nr:MAG: GntR family transcriptional regulator [Burkholderiaceae bacterium]TAM08162.1 MAG: GntR family transcriptional regulator [Pusillimonas sp.]
MASLATIRLWQFEANWREPMNKTRANAERRGPSANLHLSRYRVIEAVLREQIVSGEYEAGDKLPTEAELCTMFGASRPTVRQALGALEGDGLISREHGRGTFVKPAWRRSPPSRFEISFEGLFEPPQPLTISIQRVGVLHGYGIAHQMMNFPQGSELFYFVRIYMLGKIAIGGCKVHVPGTIRDKLSEEDFITRNVPELMAQRAGKTLASCALSVDSTLAEPRFAEITGAQTGSPLTSIRRSSFATDGTSIEHTHLLFRPDVCRLVGHKAFTPGKRARRSKSIS